MRRYVCWSEIHPALYHASGAANTNNKYFPPSSHELVNDLQKDLMVYLEQKTTDAEAKAQLCSEFMQFRYGGVEAHLVAPLQQKN